MTGRCRAARADRCCANALDAKVIVTDGGDLNNVRPFTVWELLPSEFVIVP
jgi:hypothetical protein